jgi:hypothetical protein
MSHRFLFYYGEELLAWKVFTSTAFFREQDGNIKLVDAKIEEEEDDDIRILRNECRSLFFSDDFLPLIRSFFFKDSLYNIKMKKRLKVTGESELSINRLPSWRFACLLLKISLLIYLELAQIDDIAIRVNVIAEFE